MFKWIKESNRWKHLVCGVLAGFGANSWYCAEYTICGVAGALELKDKLWGGKFDWIDLALTILGGNIGYTIRYFLL